MLVIPIMVISDWTMCVLKFFLETKVFASKRLNDIGLLVALTVNTLCWLYFRVYILAEMLWMTLINDLLQN